MLIFLCCTERSGSNLLTSLAGALPNVSAPPPSHLFRLFAQNRHRYGDLDDDSNWELLIEDVIENFDAKLGVWHTTTSIDDLRRAATGRHPFDLLRVIYEREAAAEGAAHSFVKENQTHLFAEALAEHFVDCRFVFMVRDARDVASSWVHTPTIPGGVEEAVRQWCSDQSGMLEVCRRLPADRMHRLRYEDLIADPETKLCALAEFFGVRFDPKVYDFYKHPKTIENALRIEAWRNLARPILRNNAGGYSRRLTEIDIRFVEASCGDLMRGFDYHVTSAALHQSEIDRLRSQVSPGIYRIEDSAELAIRKRRRAAIDRVLARSPK
jgi:hypothetical protein